MSRYTELMRMAHTCRSLATGTACNRLQACLEDAGFKIYSTSLRAPELEHETTPQGFVFARSPLS